jgi:hypothetical protein
VTTQGQNFRAIRSWDGSQDRAFEELCYQLRDPAPSGAALTKTGDPDGGYEWFVRHRNGVEWGWQAKYSFEIEKLLKLMEESLRTVAKRRPKCRRLTFCIPIDLPDSPDPGKRKSARQKFEDWTVSVRTRVPGAGKIKIELWQEGDLLDRLAKPEHRGRAWFFWDHEVFGDSWCRERLKVTTLAAGSRYTPELNIELPVAFALEGLGRSELFLQRYRRRRGAFLKAGRRVLSGRYTGLGVTSELRVLSLALRAAELALPPTGVVGGRFDRTSMQSAVERCSARIWPAHPDRERHAKSSVADRAGSLRHYLSQLAQRVHELSDFLSSSAAEAAEAQTLLMTGSAGQGKTHLFCDAGQRALDGGRPGVVLLGQGFAGNRVFTDLAERLGLPARGATELLGAMAAAAEASHAPFVLLIDALNDSGDPTAWQHELPTLLAEVALYAPWIAVGLSVRSSYFELIASDRTKTLPTIDHPGFDGYEYEASQRFFDAFGLEQPRIPLLLPEFTNPLFLRLYCEALATAGVGAPEVGHAHVSDVFGRYIGAKNQQISRALKLDPAANAVGAAVESFAKAVTGKSREWLAREQARTIVDAHAPHLHGWPDTLFGQLLAHGVLTDDAAYQQGGDGDWELVPSVQITFQRLADYRIAASMVAPFRTASEVKAALKSRQPLRTTVIESRAGIIEALAVVLPERFAIELLDAARWNLAEHRAQRWQDATLASVAARRDDAVTDRTAELFSALSGRSRESFEHAFGVDACSGPSVDA